MDFINKLKAGVQKVQDTVTNTVTRQISNASDTIDSARVKISRQGKSKRANFGAFKRAWTNYQQLMLRFHEEMASQRLDSLGPDFEEYFEVSALSDDDDDTAHSTPFSAPSTNEDGAIDFYNKSKKEAERIRRDSKSSPNNTRRQSIVDRDREETFLSSKLKPEL